MLHEQWEQCLQDAGMGTQVEYSLNQFTPKSGTRRAAVNTLYLTCSKIGFGDRLLKQGMQARSFRFQEHMDERLDKFSKASVRKALIEQEEIFKHQVRELHRLYDTQKVLMTNLSRGESEPNTGRRGTFDPKTALWGSASTSDSSNSSNFSCRNLCAASLKPEHNTVSGSSPREHLFSDQPVRDTSQEKKAVPGNEDIDLTLSIGPSTYRRS